MSADDLSAIQVEGYRNFARIGVGGFSSVYRAEQAALGREVAIKVLHTDLSSPEALATFERECRALGMLSRHPNIVTVYHDAVASDGRRCIVMELCHGTVRELLEREGPRPLAEVLQLGVKVGAALQRAHDEGVLHRDVKPHNIFVSDYGEPALGDFGISTIDLEKSADAESGLSLAYASPEALDGKRPTRATDIYALGVTLFQLLEGVTPFAAPRMEATMTRIMTMPAPALERSEAPLSLQTLIHQCLAKQPTDRPDSAADVVTALRAIEVELGLDRTPLPVQRQPTSTDTDLDVDAASNPALMSDIDAPTVGRPGQAIESVRAEQAGEASRAQASTSAPSLWPPGWSPWDAPDDATVVRPLRGSPQAAGAGLRHDSDAADESSADRRRSAAVALLVAALIIGVVVVAVLVR